MSDSSHHNDGSQHLLELLQAHGQKFLASFGDTPASSSKPRPTSRGEEKPAEVDDLGLEEEWTGISPFAMGNSSEGEDLDVSEEDMSDDDFEQDDDGFTADALTTKPTPTVIVFSDNNPISSSETPTTAQRKAFMSSRVGRLTTQDSQPQNQSNERSEKTDEDLTNSQNDALLYKLVHTKLLSGSANTELDLTPAQRKRAMVGRVVELAGGSSLGKGEKAQREAERNKAAKRIREGMLLKQKEREKRQLEEAKDLGNYHPALKRLWEPTTSSETKPRKREKGMKMGVGSFRGGVLKLGREEIAIANGAYGSSSRGKGSGRRGRGRGRR